MSGPEFNPRDEEQMTEEEWEEFACTCDIDGEENCPVHYPIDDGSDEDCMDCGTCDSCIERSRVYFEQMEGENG